MSASSTRIDTPNGWNARLVAGQSYQIAGENPFDEDTGLSETNSDYVAGLYLDLSRNLQFISQVRLDENDLSVKRQDFQLTGSYGPFLASVELRECASAARARV